MAVTWDYNASSGTNIDMNLTDFEGAADANGFSLYIPTRMSYNAAANTTTVTYGYMLHERTNNFSTYSCTTYLQYKIGTAAYVKSYNPATTIQYTAMTTNRYYWMGNNDGTPAIAFTSIPTSGTVASPTGTFSWSFTVNHDKDGIAPAVLVNAYMDANTNATYVPVGTTATGTLTTLLNSATYNLNYRTPYFTTTFSAAPTVTRSNNGATMSITPSNAVVTNTSANNTVTYTYYYSLDNGSTWLGATTSSAGWTGISVSPTTNYTNILVKCDTNANSISTTSAAASSAGIPSTPSISSVSESSSQSRDVTVSWTIPANNGSAITSQTLQWFSDSGLTTLVGSQVFNDATTTSYTILNNRVSGYLNPNTTYYYKITETNSVGSNGSSGFSSSTRPSAPLIVATNNTAPSSRAVVKVWNGTTMATANMMVWNGSSWQYLK